MSYDASGDVRLPHVDDHPPNAASFVIACTFAKTDRDLIHAPQPRVA